MTPAQAADVLGIHSDAAWADVRRAYRERIRVHHPDRTADGSSAHAIKIIEAFRTLDEARHHPPPSAPPVSSDPAQAHDRPNGPNGPIGPAAPGPRVHRWNPPAATAPAVARVDADTLALHAPADETFRWLIEAAHDIGEITYVDRSGPILEVLCQFEGEPATSLMITLQGRADATEAFCTAESIEARPGPPTRSVVDLLELALRRRQDSPV